jgi:hypothetical protein
MVKFTAIFRAVRSPRYPRFQLFIRGSIARLFGERKDTISIILEANCEDFTRKIADNGSL